MARDWIQLGDRVARETRIVHGAVRSRERVDWLRNAGYRNYVALVDSEGPEFGDLGLGLGASAVPYTDPKQLVRNNAELLVIEGRATALLSTRASLSHAKYLLVPASLLRTPALAARRALGNLRFLGRVAGPPSTAGSGGAQALWLFAIDHRPKVRPRLYLDPALGHAGLFAELRRRNLRYVVLRWWEGLPETPPPGDVDLLIEDDDFPAFLEILAGRVGTLPLDVYTAAGSHDHSYRGACYYPPHLARELLASAETNAHGVRIPARRPFLFSLAFHAVYHKGPASGLATGHAPGAKGRSSHDFAAILGELARGFGYAPSLTLEGLDDFLAEHGWRPPRDTLRKWSRRNPYLHARYFHTHRSAEPPGVTVFVVRRKAVEQGLLERVADSVRGEGFEIVRIAELTPKASERLRDHTRGGNWERGDFPADGGPPAVCLVAFDPRPKGLRRRFRHRYPDMDNGRIVCKRRIRDRINETLPEAERSNLLHTSDNSEEAWEYVRLALPESEPALRAAIEALRQSVSRG